MYESERKFSIRGIIVTVLLIILIICVLLWLFPIKKNENDNPKEVTYSEKFNTNIKILENAGRSYFYRATLPTKVNQSKKVTLEELIKNKKLNSLVDKDGISCDNKDSYVLLTKKNNKEFDLKSHLKCGREEKEVVSTLYCSDTKSNCNVNKTISSNTAVKNDSNNDVTYRYLYSCTDKYKVYSDWSSWSTTYVSSNNNREVQTKTETTKKYVKTGTKQEPVTTYTKQKVKETVLEEQKWVNTKPANAKSCYSVPKSNYTIYVCQVETIKEVEKEVPVTTYKTVDSYEYQNVKTTYYRYRTVDNKVNSYTYWSNNPNNNDLTSAGCIIVKSEKVTK